MCFYTKFCRFLALRTNELKSNIFCKIIPDLNPDLDLEKIVSDPQHSLGSGEKYEKEKEKTGNCERKNTKCKD